MGEDQQQALEAPQSAEDKLGEALAKIVEADTKKENEHHEAAVALLAEQQRDLSAKAAAEDARHTAAIAGLRERAVAKLLAAAQSIPTPAPAAPKVERNKRTKAQIEKDSAVIIAKLSRIGGFWSASAMANATLLDVAIVRSTLNSLVKEGRVIKKECEGKSPRITYTLPEPVESPAVNGGA